MSLNIVIFVLFNVYNNNNVTQTLKIESWGGHIHEETSTRTLSPEFILALNVNHYGPYYLHLAVLMVRNYVTSALILKTIVLNFENI